ncbi:hypothetical protein ABZ388_11860 [Micromonospora parva]|uniref:hypothetical protein n=1 Tax=Micromonospora parva TaxID=1464048 RepID=UPI003405047A
MTAVRVKSVVSNPVVKSDGSALPFLGLEDLESQTGRLLTDQLPLKEADDSIQHREGDVLFSKLRPYLAKSFLPHSPGTATGELLVLRPGPLVDERFLFYATLSSPWVEWANTTAYGIKMPRTSWDLIGEYRMWLPSREEQRRISKFLDAATAQIGRLGEAMRQQIAVLAERRSRALDSVWPVRDTPSKRLGYGTQLVTSGSRGWADFVGDFGSLFFRSANLRRDSLQPNLTSLAYVQLPTSVKTEALRSQIRKGDVLVGITGANTGWTTFADDSIEGGNVSQHVCLVRPARDEIDGRWLAYLIASPTVQTRLLGSQYGGTKTQLSLPDIRDIRVPVLSLQKQQGLAAEVDGLLESLDQQRDLRKRQLGVLAERRQALITATVTGQIDVSAASGRGIED